MLKRIVGVLSIACLLLACNDPNEDNAAFLEEQLIRNQQEIQDYINNQGLNMEQTSSGLYYQVTGTPGTRVLANKLNNIVSIRYISRMITADIVIDSTYITDTLTLALDTASSNRFGVIAPPGLEEGIRLMSAGQKATLLMAYNIGYGSSSNSFLPPFSAIRIDVEVLEVQTEQQLIDKFIAKNYSGKTPTTATFIASSDSLEYTVKYISLDTNDTREPTTPITDSATFEMKYAGILLIRGTIFDSSIKPRSNNPTTTFSFEPKVGSVIQGWQIGVPLMQRIGEKGVLFIPSALAYGRTGDPQTRGRSVPPYQPLYFELELIDVRARQ